MTTKRGNSVKLESARKKGHTKEAKKKGKNEQEKSYTKMDIGEEENNEMVQHAHHPPYINYNKHGKSQITVDLLSSVCSKVTKKLKLLEKKN